MVKLKNSQSGVVLPLVLVLVLAVSAAVVGTLYSVYIGQFSSRAERTSAMALHTAQTGLDKYRTIIFNQARYDIAAASEITSWSGDDPLLPLITGDGEGGPACNPLILGFPALVGGEFGFALPGEFVTEYLDLGTKLPGSDDDKILSPGRFTVALTIADLSSAANIYSEGEVLLGIPEGEDPDTFVPFSPYPKARVGQTVMVQNASLMSHALITKDLNSSDKGLQVIGPAYIEGYGLLSIGTLNNDHTASGDIALFDSWPVVIDENSSEDEEEEIVLYPARPWPVGGKEPTEPEGLGNLSFSLAEGNPTSLCARLRMPNGSLNFPSQLESSLAYITGVHIKDGLPDIQHPFDLRPGLATSYDLNPISFPNSSLAYTAELSIPSGLAKYYSSTNIGNEQNQEDVKDLKGGKNNLKIADDNPAPDGIIISYEWLRVDENGEKHKYYIQHQGLDDSEVDACTGGNKVMHPDYDTSADTNAHFTLPPLSCATCVPCDIDVYARFPTTGEDNNRPVRDPGDIVWPTYDKGGDLVLGTGNINAEDSKKRIPMFNMSESFQCIHKTGEGPNDWVGMKWDQENKKLEVKGPVTIEGIELPLEEAGGQIAVEGDGLLTLREREIRLIADHKSYEVVHKRCWGVSPVTEDICSCDFDEIVEKEDISLPTNDGSEKGSAQGEISDPKSIDSYYFALFKHGGKAGYSGSSDNGFTQDLPSLVLPRYYQDPDSEDESDQYTFTFPMRPVSSVPVIVSDPNFPNELDDDHIYAGIIYHDKEVKFKGNAAAVGRVMAPKVTVEGRGAQIFGVSGYEYHLNTDFEDWLNEDAGLDDVVVKNLPVLNIVSETRDSVN